MSNYLELKVPIRWDAVWFRQLRKAVAAAGISEASVRWQRQHHHITAAFINDDGLAEPLAAAFDRLLSSCEPPMLTFDKVDAFMAKDAPVIIVNLTSTKPSPAMMALIQSLRKAASDLGADLDNDFLLHVTLGRIDARAASAEQVKRIADAIQVTPFTLPLDEAEHRFYRGRSISSWTMGHHHTNHNRNHQNNQTMEKKVIQTSCGEVTKVKDKWFFRFTSGDDKDVVDIPYTDGHTTDTFLIRHNGKYGVYSLPSDYIFDSYVNPNLKSYCYDGPTYWMALHEDPFPYDEVKIVGMRYNYFGMMAYRIGNKWGIMYFYDTTEDGYVEMREAVPCKYPTLEAAGRQLLAWENPFNRKQCFEQGIPADLPRINGEWDYHTINREVMVDTKEQYETVPALQEAVQHSIGHQYMVAQEEALDQPAAGESHTHYITSARRTFEAAKEYVGKKTAVLNFANNHSVGGAPFSAGAQEESLCRCSTIYPCLQAMYGQFYQKHIDEYERRQIDETGSDDLIYTPDVVVFKTDERTDPVYPRMMKYSDWYKVDIITCAAPDLRYRARKPRSYEEMITRRIKKILDVAAKEKAEVLILGAWGCGAFGNDIAVVSKAFYSLLESYNFETVEFALGSTKFFDHFQKGTVVG